MTRGEVCEQMSDLAASYALGAVSTAERLSIEAHVQECRRCASELVSYEEVVGYLSLACGEEHPSIRVRGRLLNHLGSCKRPVSEAKGFSHRSRAMLWAIAVSLAVSSLAGFIAWRATRTAAEMRKDLAASRISSSELRVSLQLERDRSRDRELAAAALNDPTAGVVPLEGQGPIRGKAGRVHWDQQNRLLAITAILPTPSQGKTYQLWFINVDQEKISAGLIKPDSSDCSFTVVRVPPEIGQLAAAAITLEPEGGSTLPTLPAYAVGRFL